MGPSSKNRIAPRFAPGRALAALAAAALGSALAAPSALERELPSLRDAAAKGQAKVVEAARARFAGHPLEPYPHYWQLSAQLGRADPAEVRAFLDRYPGTPLAEALRRDWLKVLGAAGAWEAFRAEHARLAAGDAEIACYSFQERLARGDAEARAEARALFVSGREVPAACDPVFATLVAEGAMGAAEIATRTRALLLANQPRDAKRAQALLAPRARLDDRQLDAAAANPARALARHAGAAALTQNEREVMLFAIARLARTRPEDAAEALEQFASRLGEEATRLAWAHVATQAAWAHHPRALEWYAAAGDAPLSPQQAAWLARAALRAGEWKQVYAAIGRLPPEEARESAWRYWRARALAALGESEASTALLRGLALESGFYGLLAAEELGGALPAPEWDGWKPASADLERVAALPGVARALGLYRAGLDPEALREWVWATRTMDDRDLLAAAELFRRAGEVERAINTANRTHSLHDFAQRYPVAHEEAIVEAARRWEVDAALAFSIVRQESRFVPHARSRAGATGLMQLMPATARWVARQIPVRPFRPEMLTQPELNASMGTYYLARVLSELGHPVLATAAYNAGPGRARRWRDAGPLEGAIYIETIPFNETRDYVKQVLANVWYYRHRLTGEPTSLKALVGVVPGRAADGRAALASNLP